MASSQEVVSAKVVLLNWTSYVIARVFSSLYFDVPSESLEIYHREQRRTTIPTGEQNIELPERGLGHVEDGLRKLCSRI